MESNLDFTKIVNMYENNNAVVDIANCLNISISYVYKILKKYNINMFQIDNNRKYYVNHNFFNEWTPLMSYWLGYLCADGHLCKSNSNLELSSSDDGVLENFLLDIDSNYEVRKQIRNEKSFSPGTIRKYVCLRSSELKRSLINLKFNEFKTGGVELINAIPANLFSHWLRGMTDGDGTISIIKENKTYYPTWRLVGPNENQLRHIGQLISSRLSISNLNVYDSKTIYVITAKKNKGLRIMQYLYENDVRSMKRKKEKYLTIVDAFRSVA